VKILALDTSTEYCSVALWLDGEIEAQACRAGQHHSELLLGMVERVLAGRSVRLEELDGIAFGQGPGSFTGLRIACGVTQGLAAGAGLPVVGVSTLLALAQAAGAERALCCLDARMGEIYHAAFVRERERWVAVREPSLCAPQSAPPLPEGVWTGCGSGFAVHGEALARRYGERLGAVKPELFPHAREIAALAAPQFREGRALPAEHAVPLYIRDRVALRPEERAGG
jgi:tRNA threonylcarbamoyladenosine biosynthesis protein TsaB